MDNGESLRRAMFELETQIDESITAMEDVQQAIRALLHDWFQVTTEQVWTGELAEAESEDGE